VQHIPRNKTSYLRLKEQELQQALSGKALNNNTEINEEGEIPRGTGTQINHTKLKLQFV